MFFIFLITGDLLVTVADENVSDASYVYMITSSENVSQHQLLHSSTAAAAAAVVNQRYYATTAASNYSFVCLYTSLRNRPFHAPHFVNLECEKHSVFEYLLLILFSIESKRIHSIWYSNCLVLTVFSIQNIQYSFCLILNYLVF